MNVLFYVDHSVATGFGGQERATGSVAEALTAKGVRCYYVYRLEYNNDKCSDRDVMFVDNRFVPDSINTEEELFNLVSEWDVDAVVVQGVFGSIRMWRRIVDASSKPCRLIFAHHFCPKSELEFMNRDYYLSILFGNERKKSERYWAFKQLISNNRNWRNTVKSQYKAVYENADSVILLSNGFVYEWQEFAGVDDSKEGKIRVIPNMLSIKSAFSESLDNKEKIVLIVSRLEEKGKRISKALRLWRQIEKLREFEDWSFVIVGDGPERGRYEEYAAKYLTRVTFEGYKEPERYYRRASIFMMTSAFEGWGLTLTEAQQFGCVPIALNTFASASDIINNDKNGFLVNNLTQYEKCLKLLMSDTTLRQRMALNAIESSKRFAPEAVIEKWMDVLNNN